MGEVYQHCLCNIAASWTKKNPGESLFLTREPELCGPVLLTWLWNEYGAEFSILADWWTTINWSSPLQKRGWVLQERLLSPRTMHYSQYLLWECKEMFTETVPTPAQLALIPRRPRPLKLSWMTYKNNSPVDWWSRIMYDYSRTSLTKITDKLIALSGVARMICQASGVDYYAGILSYELPRGLLWIVDSDSSSVRIPEYIGTATQISPSQIKTSLTLVDSTIMVVGFGCRRNLSFLGEI